MEEKLKEIGDEIDDLQDILNYKLGRLNSK